MDTAGKLSDIIAEVAEVVRQIDHAAVEKLVAGLLAAEKVFVFGQGRTGYVTRAFAVRLMHLGFIVHVVGDASTPPITPGDLCLVNSGTGETRFSWHVAEAAREAGAAVATITAHREARIAQMADIVLYVPAPTKGQAFGPRTSRQPAGSLFEQALYLLLDAVVLDLMERLGGTTTDLIQRHANIE